MTDDAHERGMRIRRDVLGDEHVDRAIERTTEETADFQDFITRYAWGEIWARPGLDRRTRSCITLTALVALNRDAELELHMRAGAEKRPHARRDHRSPAAKRGLLRRPGSQRGVRDVPARPRGRRINKPDRDIQM